jgi:hypothetical protein
VQGTFSAWSETTPDEPIDDQVPVPDAVEQRLEVGETPRLSEDFEPTEVNEIAAQTAPPEDADPADWQEQRTSAPDADEWDPDLDR